MKNLMMIALVLGIASIASAGLLEDITLTLEGTTMVVEGVGTSVAVNPVGFGMYVNTGGIVNGGITSTVNAGDARAAVQWNGWNGIDVTVFDADALDGGVVLGEWFTFTYNGAVGDTFDIYDYNVSGTAPVGQLAVQGIPEPMTMALLGLGGLFLRRRK